VTFYYWYFGLLAAGMLVYIALTFVPAVARFSVRHLVIAKGLPISDDLMRTVSRRLIVRHRVAFTGGLVGLAVGWLLSPGPAGAPVGSGAGGGLTSEDGWFVLVLVAAGLSIGTALGATFDQFVRPDTAMRLARLRPTRISDYVATPHRLIAWLTVASAVAIMVIRDIRASVEGPPPASANILLCNYIVGIGLLGMLIFEIAGRRIVARAQPAGSSVELVWDDALRASSLRDLVLTPSYLCAYAFLLVAAHGANTSSAPLDFVLAGLYVLLVVGWLASIVASRSARHQYLERLWPNGPGADFFEDEPEKARVL
jgi:hypothetical protein